MFLLTATTLGFMLTVRGATQAPLQRPLEGLARIWREAVDLMATLSLILALRTAVMASELTQVAAAEYGILGAGVIAYLLSRYQKKPDLFFLTVAALAFAAQPDRAGLGSALGTASALIAGMAFFQSFFLGLRYQSLFSRVPHPFKGWPALCLLAAFIALAGSFLRF